MKEKLQYLFEKYNIPTSNSFFMEIVDTLSTEPYGDCVSRKAVLNILNTMDKVLDKDRTVEHYKELLEECYKVLSNSKTKWILLSEKLPTFDEDVLVTNGNGIYVGWIDPTDKILRVDSESEYFPYDMVAWMPLPKPYIESEE